jgi:hypothetical protein
MSAPRRPDRDSRYVPAGDNWLDRAVSEARQRGDFDDLPGRGEPIPLGAAQPDNEWELAFSILKNAGFAPYWVELGKEIDKAISALQASREQAREYILERLALARAPEASPVAEEKPRSSRFFRRSAKPPQPRPENSGLKLADIETERLRLRAAYLEKAAEIDAKIREYHRALPDGLWRQQRTLSTPEQAAADFDGTCPPVLNPVS